MLANTVRPSDLDLDMWKGKHRPGCLSSTSWLPYETRQTGANQGGAGDLQTIL